jgi:hypothetical protein
MTSSLRAAHAVAFICLAWQTPAAASEKVTFSNRLPAVGSASTQDLQVVLHLTSSGDPAAPGTPESYQSVESRQRRTVRVEEIDDEKVNGVTVAYEVAQETVTADGDTGTGRRPVVGKTYKVRRNGDDLEITLADGSTPADDEIQFVRRNMDAVGRTNPLGDFLSGKTIQVGQTVELPDEAARKLLGFEEAVGQRPVTVKLTLEKVVDLGGVRCGQFAARMQANSTQVHGLSLFVQGKLWIQIETSRPLAAELTGPVAIFQESQKQPGQPAVGASGTMRVAMRTQSVKSEVR